MNPILTIGITSYKRINELIRCIKSIQTDYIDDVEILVSEDKSPLSKEIMDEVNKLACNSKYNIRFTSNQTNLGYDMNLGAIIKKARGKYVFFMSDDDMMVEKCLDEIIPFLKKGADYGVLYAPFVYSINGKKDRNRSKKNFAIISGENNAAKYVYDSILFSGLIFCREYVKDLDSSRFKNYNYFQVYMFLQMLLKHGGYYFSSPTVLCVGDGENAYGLSESSKCNLSEDTEERNAILANRESVKSNLEFNKTLIKVIRMFDDDEGTKIIDDFAKQYSFHSISGLSIARQEGRQYFEEYYKTLVKLDIKLHPIVKCYYVLLNMLGAKNTTKLLCCFRKFAKKEW